MRRSFLSHTIHFAVGIAVALGTLALPFPASADILLYSGEPAEKQGIVVANWGGGVAEETTEERWEADRTLKVRVRDLYQGVRLDFQKPRSITTVLRQPNPYISLTMKMRAHPIQIAVGGFGGGMGAGMAHGAGGPGFGEGGGGGSAQVPPISRVRVVLVGENRSLEALSVGELNVVQGNWVNVGVPLNRVKAQLGDEPFAVRRMLISADAPDTVYIGEVRLINDNTRISAQVNADRFNDIRVNTTVVFTAEANGGLTPLDFYWDFDDRDGIQEEMIQRGVVTTRVERAFPRPGRYTVTVTIKPGDGAQKEPSVETIQVEIVP